MNKWKSPISSNKIEIIPLFEKITKRLVKIVAFFNFHSAQEGIRTVKCGQQNVHINWNLYNYENLRDYKKDMPKIVYAEGVH